MCSVCFLPLPAASIQPDKDEAMSEKYSPFLALVMLCALLLAMPSPAAGQAVGGETLTPPLQEKTGGQSYGEPCSHTPTNDDDLAACRVVNILASTDHPLNFEQAQLLVKEYSKLRDLQFQVLAGKFDLDDARMQVAESDKVCLKLLNKTCFEVFSAQKVAETKEAEAKKLEEAKAAAKKP